MVLGEGIGDAAGVVLATCGVGQLAGRYRQFEINRERITIVGHRGGNIRRLAQCSIHWGNRGPADGDYVRVPGSNGGDAGTAGSGQCQCVRT